MPDTPAVTTARNALFAQIDARMDPAVGAWFLTRVREMQETANDLSELPVLFGTRGTITTVERNILRNHRTIDIEFVFRGYVESTDNRDDVEKLEYDLARALAWKPTLGGIGMLGTYTAGDFYDSEETDEDGGKVAVSAFRAVFIVRVIETLESD